MKLNKAFAAVTVAAMLCTSAVMPAFAAKPDVFAVHSDGSTTVMLTESVKGTVTGVKYENGRLKEVRTADIDGTQAVLDGIEADRVFIWDSLEEMKPLCVPADAKSATEVPTPAATEDATPAASTTPTESAEPGYEGTEVDFTAMDTVPVYSDESGQGFVEYSSAIMPEGYARQAAPVSEITISASGASVTEMGAAYTHAKTNSDDGDDYNYGGMIYRADTGAAGAYHIEVEVTGSSSDTRVAPTGMDAPRLTGTSNWDNAGNVPRHVYASWSGSKWSYDFATGENFVEIEIEPTALGSESAPRTVGVKSIKITPIAVKPEGDKPTIHILGDSTQKTYTFNETISSWGQTLGNYFGSDKVNVINYSMGGRAMKSNYNEGRFNEILINGGAGDFVFIHSAHNDETISRNRFSRGSGSVSGDLAANNAVYNKWLDMYVSAIKARGMIPVLVTAMPRINSAAGMYSESDAKPNGFNPDSPGNMRAKAASDDGIGLAELYEGAKAYINMLDPKEVSNIYNMIEAGETPAANSANGANGDGTHYREAAAKQFCRIILQSIYDQANAGTDTYTDKSIMTELVSYMAEGVEEAAQSGDWSAVFPEMASDVSAVGVVPGAEKQGIDGFYYRTSIEKALQLGLLHKDTDNLFKPASTITVGEFARGAEKAFGLTGGVLINYERTAAELAADSDLRTVGEEELGTASEPMIAAEDVTVGVEQTTGGTLTIYNESDKHTTYADVPSGVAGNDILSDNDYFTLTAPESIVARSDKNASFGSEISTDAIEFRYDTAEKQLKYTSKADGVITLYMYFVGSKLIICENTADKSQQSKYLNDEAAVGAATNSFGYATFNVKAGSSYVIGTKGGTGRLFGMKYEAAEIPSSTVSLAVKPGDQIKVVAEADDNYSLESILINGEPAGYAKEYTFTANAASVVSAVFTEKAVGDTAINVVQPEGGSITVYNESAYNTVTADIPADVTADSVIDDNKYFTLTAPSEIAGKANSSGVFADNPAVSTNYIEIRNNGTKQIKYSAKADGVITMYLRFDNTKLIICANKTDGTTAQKYINDAEAAAEERNQATFGIATFNVKAGKNYELYTNGGTGQLYGIKYASTDYPQSTEQLLVSKGDTVRVSVVPDSGYVLEAITIDGETAATGREYTFEANESVTVSAVLTSEPAMVETTIVAADAPLTREVMGAILYDAYQLADKTNISKYMAQNGGVPSPDDPNYDPNIKYEGSPYIPITGWGALTDKDGLSGALYAKVKAAYNLGLIRPETGIARGSIALGTELEPTSAVTRAKAAKSLVFSFILTQPISGESQTVPANFGAAAPTEIELPNAAVQLTVYTK